MIAASIPPKKSTMPNKSIMVFTSGPGAVKLNPIINHARTTAINESAIFFDLDISLFCYLSHIAYSAVCTSLI